MTDDDFRRFAEDCLAELHGKQAQIAELLAFERDLDLSRGVATYSADGEPYIEAEVVPVGSRGRTSGTWLWAWANPLMTGTDGVQAQAVRDIASTTGRSEFAAGAAFAATESQAREYAAIARRHVGGAGVVRFDANDSDWFFVVRPLTHLRPEAEIVAQAQRAVARSLVAAHGPALLNTMRQRFPTLRVELIGADLRGAAEPWAHDLHAQVLFDVGRLTTHAGHDLSGANLSGARLDGASLRSAFLNGANLTQSRLTGADLGGAELSRTLLADVDLSAVKGLDDVYHLGPSEVSMSALIASNFEIDPAFLRKAGVSRGLIEDLMRGKRFAGSLETCFLSYSSKDGEFAARLYASLTGAGVRVFWDHLDVFPGEALDAQIAEAIREHRRLLVVLSPHSMASDWVVREMQLAWAHRRESLLPVRLGPIEEVMQWTAAHEGLPDLASAFPIHDFSGCATRRPTSTRCRWY